MRNIKILKKIGNGIKDYFASTDKFLILICMLLSGISLVFLYGLQLTGHSTMDKVYTQLIAAGGGLVIAVIISLFDYRSLVRLWKIYVPLSILPVLMTFFVGVERGSNRAWLSINLLGKSFSMQPAEFLKIAFIMTFSLHLNHVKDDMNKLSNFLLLALHGAAYTMLIVVQKDAGTAIVFFGIFVVMMFLAGLGLKYIIAGLVALPPVSYILWNFVMSGDQKMRFLVMKDPSVSDRYAYQQQQGLKALGLGGIQGTGFYGKHVYVPESYNDFIFTFIGETAGLIGCIAIIVILLVLCGRLVYNAHKSFDGIGFNLCNGVMAMILVQSIMNIGMCINILPVIGVTLPLLSSGGSSVLAIYIGIGLALSVHRHKDTGIFNPEF